MAGQSPHPGLAKTSLTVVLNEIAVSAKLSEGLIANQPVADKNGKSCNLLAKYPPGEPSYAPISMPGFAPKHGPRFLELWIDKHLFGFGEQSDQKSQVVFNDYAHQLEYAIKIKTQQSMGLKKEPSVIVRTVMPDANTPPFKDGKIGLFIFCNDTQKPHMINYIDGLIASALRSPGRIDPKEAARYAQPNDHHRRG